MHARRQQSERLGALVQAGDEGAVLEALEAPDAAADPLGAALMQIAGIRNILIHDGWISIGKDPAADWKSLKAAVKKVLSEAS